MGLLDQPSSSVTGIWTSGPGGGRDPHTPHRVHERLARSPVSLVTAVDMGLRPWGSLDQPSQLTDQASLSLLLKAGAAGEADAGLGTGRGQRSPGAKRAHTCRREGH